MLNWIISLLIAVTIHEFSHGYVSYKLGDPTPKEEGRITLNPLKHIDGVGLLFLVILGFGWAKPVMVKPEYYKDKKKGLMLVALAGPLSNFIVVLFIIVVIKILNMLGVNQEGIRVLLDSIIGVNLILGIFNLIPLAPLDGSKILGGLLPNDVELDDRVGIAILIVLIFSGHLQKLVVGVYTPIFYAIQSII